MRKIVIVMLTCSILFAGCAGRQANPIQTYMPGDSERSCEGLKVEMSQLNADMRAMLPKTDKTASNALLGAAGVFLIVPWFFMDFKGAEKIEYDAMRNRYNHLLVIAAEKGCNTSGAQRIPSTEEIKKMSNEEREAFKKAFLEAEQQTENK